MAIFFKSLTKTDVAKTLSVPTEFLKHLPDFKGERVVEILATDESGRFWNFSCSIRRNGHPKPVLYPKNWLSFVRSKELKVGDKIKFCKEYDHVTGAQYKIEVKRAIFFKSLTKTDVAKTLSVPTEFLKHLPDFKGKRVVEILATDESGRFWNFSCSIRRNGHPKPVLYPKNWLSFVRSKELKVGDKIKFCKEYDHVTGAQYKIEVKRAVRLFGVIIG